MSCGILLCLWGSRWVESHGIKRDGDSLTGCLSARMVSKRYDTAYLVVVGLCGAGTLVEGPTCLLCSWTALGMLCKPRHEGKISNAGCGAGGLLQCWLCSEPAGKPACCASVPGLLLPSHWLASLISTVTLPSLEVQAGGAPWAVKLLLCCFCVHQKCSLGS